MSQKYVINPNYAHLDDFVLHVKDHFASSNESIHKARNELRVIEYKGLKMVIKAFKIPHLINRFAYAYIRDSKSKKSYFNALELEKRGINTPSPVAYIEFYEMGLLKESYFIALHVEYNFTIREALHHKAENFSDILNSFAHFSTKVHQAGIWHVDYSPGNILVTCNDNSYTFNLVDINRMEFKNITPLEGLGNFNKLYAKEEDLKNIATTYASINKIEKPLAIKIALLEAKKHQDKNELKKRLKGR